MKKKADNTRYFAWIENSELTPSQFIKLAIINKRSNVFSGITYSGERVNADSFDYAGLRNENFDNSKKWREVKESEAVLLL